VVRKPAPYDTRAGHVVVVTRHPRPGREIAAFGGARRFRGKDVLDIGTGNGRLALDAAPYARHVTGVDPSDGAIEVARRRADAQGIRNVDFRVGSAQELDAIHERYDIAIFSWSL
jgi:ubiquinone/menaquinone biosynthesis C-methylase UbiE